MARFWILRLSLMAAALAGATAEAQELRGIWAARDSLGSREQIRTMMKNLDEGNFNAVFVNVWSRGYPLWPSDVFERETGIRIDPGYAGRDVLREAMEEAKPYGIAVIPWVEYGFVAGFSGYFPGPGRRGPIFERHPDWLAQNRAGEVRFPIAGGGDFFWMIHAHPDVQEFLIQLMEELVRNYEVPAIEFDRARYPTLDCGYDPVTKELYAKDNNGEAPPEKVDEAGWIRWRADNINRFLKRMSQRVKAIDWRVLMTNAPVQFPFSYVNFAQEYPAWVREGSVDFISPQIYWSNSTQYARELDLQMSRLPDTSRLIPGIDVSNSRNVEDLGRQIRSTRDRGLRGFVVWYYGALVQLNNGFRLLKEQVLGEKVPLPWR